jgi:hypothetical protein
LLFGLTIMDLANSVSPLRAVIRCKVKMHLTQAAYAQQVVPDAWDEALLKEIATTWFRSEAYATMLQHCRSKREAAAIEDRVAAEIAAIYSQIVQQQENPLVQQLNDLL